MGIFSRFKLNILSSFREFFIYQYSSIKFRAKIFAFIISANTNYGENDLDKLRQISLSIYADKNRADALVYTSKEILDKLSAKNDFYLDNLINSIQRDLKNDKKYINKIDIELLKEFINFTNLEEDRIYQNHILNFLENIKNKLN